MLKYLSEFYNNVSVYPSDAEKEDLIKAVLAADAPNLQSYSIHKIETWFYRRRTEVLPVTKQPKSARAHRPCARISESSTTLLKGISITKAPKKTLDLTFYRNRQNSSMKFRLSQAERNEWSSPKKSMRLKSRLDFRLIMNITKFKTGLPIRGKK